MIKEVICITRFGIVHDGKGHYLPKAKHEPVKDNIYKVDEIKTINGKDYYHIIGCDDDLRCYYDSTSFADLEDHTDEINEALTAQTPVKKVKEHLLDAHGYLAMPDAVRKWYNDTLPLWP